MNKLTNSRNKVLKQLISDLESKSSIVKGYASDMLVKMGWRPSNQEEQIVYFIASRKWKNLIRIGPPAVEYLINTLNESDNYVKPQVIETLGEIGDYRAVTHLIAILNGEGLTPKKLVSKLKELLNNLLSKSYASLTSDITAYDDEVRDDIYNVEPFIAALKDDITLIRASAAKALGRIGNTLAVIPLLLALKENALAIQENALNALNMIGGKAVEPLTFALSDEDPEFRRFAVKILGRMIKSDSVLEPLFFALKDKNPSVKVDAIKALGRIGDKRAVEPIISLLKEKEVSVRESAAEILGILGDKRAFESLVSALNDKDFSVRESSAKALGRIGDKRAVEPLMFLLEDKDPFVKTSAIKALGMIGDKRATKSLIFALKDENKWVRGSAAHVLGKMDVMLVIEPLIAALKDKSRHVQWEAISTLAKTKDPKAINTLVEILRKGETSFLKRSAANALKEIDYPRSSLPERKVIDIKAIKTKNLLTQRPWARLNGNFKNNEPIPQKLTP